MSAEAGSPISTYFRVCDGCEWGSPIPGQARTSPYCWRHGPKACGPSVASGAAFLQSGGWSPSTCQDSATLMVARNWSPRTPRERSWPAWSTSGAWELPTSSARTSARPRPFYTVPWAIANASYKQQKRNPGVTEIVKIPGRGHSLTIDHGWREVAGAALAFIQKHAQPW